MEVIYTPDIFSWQHVGGISRYFVELAARLPAPQFRAIIAAGLHRNAYLRHSPRVWGAYTSKAYKRRWLNAQWCRAVCRLHPRALVHETYYRLEAYSHRNPAVLTVYDMIDELRGPQGTTSADPERPSAIKRAACDRAAHVIAISEATKADLVRIFGIAPGKVTVVHLATSFSEDDRRLPSAGDALPRPYLLHVGPRVTYKNFAVLLEAYAGSASLREHFALLCFGGGAFTAPEKRRLHELGVADQVYWRGGDDDALKAAYTAATAYVCPSLYEGFGIPVLEAMSLGCPVFCARTPALEEVAGGAAITFDARSSADLRAKLEAGLTRTEDLAAQVERGRQRVRQFSWDRCAAETLAVYRKVA